ncbi:MAG: cohesin domain-containing protein [bacterium]
MFKKSLLFILTLSFFLSACHRDRSPFFEGETNPANNSVYMEGNFTEGDLLEIRIKAKGITADHVFGASFYLDFNPSILNYESYAPGNFLENIGQVQYFVNSNSMLNKLIIGISQKNSNLGANGDGVLITLKFRIISKVRSEISFSNNELINLNDKVIDGIIWCGGALIAP